MDSDQIKQLVEKIEGPKALVYLGLADLVSNTVATIVLSQVLYGFKTNENHSKNWIVWRNNQPWIARTRPKWAQLCACSEKQFDAALARLEKLRFISKRTHRRNGVPTLHVTLRLEELLGALGKQNSHTLDPKVHGGHTQSGENDFTKLGKSKIPKAAKTPIELMKKEEESLEDGGGPASQEEILEVLQMLDDLAKASLNSAIDCIEGK